MPAKAMRGTPGKLEIPGTILRSEKHAQNIWRKAHDSAVKTYGEGGRAHRVAYAALKHEYEKRGDKWVRKVHPGASDPQAARGPTTQPASTDVPAAPTGAGKLAQTDEQARVKAKEARKEYAQTRRKQTRTHD